MSENAMKQPEQEERFEQASTAPQGEPSGPEFDFNYIKSTATTMLMEPVKGWQEIKQANMSVRSIYMRYALFLFAVPAICAILTFANYSIAGAITYGLFSFAASLGMVYALGFILRILAIKFDSECTLENGVALTVFAATPQFIAPVIGLLPSIIFSLISLVVSLYGIRLFYLGIDELTTVPAESKLKFFLSFIGCAIVCGIVLAALGRPFMPMPDVITTMPFQ